MNTSFLIPRATAVVGTTFPGDGAVGGIQGRGAKPPGRGSLSAGVRIGTRVHFAVSWFGCKQNQVLFLTKVRGEVICVVARNVGSGVDVISVSPKSIPAYQCGSGHHGPPQASVSPYVKWARREWISELCGQSIVTPCLVPYAAEGIYVIIFITYTYLLNSYWVNI